MFQKNLKTLRMVNFSLVLAYFWCKWVFHTGIFSKGTLTVLSLYWLLAEKSEDESPINILLTHPTGCGLHCIEAKTDGVSELGSNP